MHHVTLYNMWFETRSLNLAVNVRIVCYVLCCCSEYYKINMMFLLNLPLHLETRLAYTRRWERSTHGQHRPSQATPDDGHLYSTSPTPPKGSKQSHGLLFIKFQIFLCTHAFKICVHLIWGEEKTYHVKVAIQVHFVSCSDVDDAYQVVADGSERAAVMVERTLWTHGNWLL